jgi:alanine racemase
MVVGKHRPTTETIDLEAISWNIQQIRKGLSPGKKFFAVVKADAYGLGAVPVAKKAKEAGVDGFCVALLDEAMELRENGLSDDFIMVVGPTEAEDAALIADNGISVAVTATEWLEAALPHLQERKTQLPIRVHLAIDTGMGRIGLRTVEEVKVFEARLAELDGFVFEGIFTHFATADGEDPTLVERQRILFEEILAGLAQRPPIVHLANSAISLWHEAFRTDAVRVGIAMYGYNPSDTVLELPYELKPSVQLDTQISYVKQMHEGDTIAYGARYRAFEGEWIATLPIGYADGWRRDLRHQTVIVDGQRCPIRGVICMDQCMISLPKEYPVGTKVTLLGENGGLVNNPSEMAVEIDTIGYEILTGINARVPRIYK